MCKFNKLVNKMEATAETEKKEAPEDGAMPANIAPQDAQALKDLGLKFKKWIPLESNPDVFTQYGYELGLPSSL